MDPPAVRVLLALLLVLLAAPPVAPGPCPRPCSCPQPAELQCTFRSLSAVPAAVSKHVERVNLGFNSINKITEASLAGLRKLGLLLLHGNDIHSLPDGVFRDLSSLQMLKMSYNKLKEINRHTLRGLWALARLHLDHNRLEFIHPDAFQGLTSLRVLQLEGNRLQQLHPATFTTFTLMGYFHVSTLRHLYLADNGLVALPSKLIASMPQLENLYLHGNPWTCDCNMRWLREWDKTSPGVLKCKKDKALPGGQLCPMCSSPRHLQREELQTAENLVCSSPVIAAPLRTSPPDESESELMTTEDFRDPFGNISLGLSDEHGNEVDLECNISEPTQLTKINWERLNQIQLAFNVTLSVDIECPVDREKYERLWRLIAYYSSVPAHLQRGALLREDPHPTYVYRQDSEKDALYYTGVRVHMMAQPAWLMQTSADLQLNRLQSSAKMVKLILSTDFSETAEAELVRRQRRTWVMIESTNTTRKLMTAILGSQSQMNCNVHSSGQPVIQWMLPDGSKVAAPSSSPDNRLSVSADGLLVIKAVSHADTGIYYCIAKVHGDLAVLPFHLTVQESSSPLPGEDSSSKTIEGSAGNPLSLPCTASGSPDAEINWILPSNNIVSFKANSSRAFVNSNGTLHIRQTQVLDSGYYKCIAINQHGVDTLATKISLSRRKGPMRPLRKFPVRPQSASGLNTQIKVPTEDTDEASGNFEITQVGVSRNPSDPPRRRVPGGAAGRRGVHPSRSMRPQKPTGAQTEDVNNIGGNRRTINLSNSKIDPKKWADIMAKIRDRNAQNAVTSAPVQPATERKPTEQTTPSHETVEGSSDGVALQEKEGQDYFTTPHTPAENTHLDTAGQGGHVTSDGDAAHHTHEAASDSLSVRPTAEPHATQTADGVQHTKPDANFKPHAASNGVFLLPQTTSVPTHAVTSWQGSTNSASSSGTSPPQETHSANTDGVKTADWSETSQRRENTEGPEVVVGYDGDRESHINPSVTSDEAETSQEENGKHLFESDAEPSDKTPEDLQSQAPPMTSSPTSRPTATRRRGSKGQAPSRRRPHGSRRRNGNRQGKQSRRKAKPDKPTEFTVPTPDKAAVATQSTAAPPLLKIEQLEITTARFNTTVPFRGSQAASAGRLSHEESGHEAEAASKPSTTPTAPPETSGSLLPPAKPPFKSTSAAPLFPAASPGAGHAETSSQTAPGISESVSPADLLDVFTSAAQQRFTGSPPPPVQPSGGTQRPSTVGDLGPVPRFDSSSGWFHTVTQEQTDVGLNQSAHQYTATETSAEMLFKETDEHFSSPSASAASLIELEMKTTPGYASKGSISTPSMLVEGEPDTEEVTTEKTTAPGIFHKDHNQNKTTSRESEEVKQLEEAANTGTDASFTSVTTRSSVTETSTDAVIPSTAAPHVTRHEASSTADPSPRAATQEAPRINDVPEIRRVSTSQAPQTDFLPETQSADHELASFSTNPTFPSLNPTSGQTVEQTATSAPTTAESQTQSSKEESLISSQDVSTELQLPGPGSVQRGKPRINKNDSQTVTVKAETDAQLPCEAEGEPRPFLSWTKVSSGASIAQNTKVQRFEVHPNGSLIIRSTQPTDGGQYLCTVQNQYGTDNMVVQLAILSQHPIVLQPRHRDVTVHLGGTVDLECKVEGHPPPRVTWVLPNNVHMAAAPHGVASQQRVAVVSNGTLRLSQAAFTDRGVYKCIGSSAAGADTVSVRLYVSALPPVIQQMQQENSTVPEGSNVYVHCTATGAPQPVIRWVTPDGAQLTASQFVTGHNVMVFPNGTLYIQGLGLGNAGRYECSAANTVGSSQRTVILSMRRNPSSAKASITLSSPQRTDVIYGGTLLLNCVARGAPEPRIIWRTPSKKLVDAQYSFDSRIKVFPNGTISVHSVTEKDSGDYLCAARNKMGDDYVVLRVNVLTLPAKIKQKQQQSSQEVVYGGDLKVDCVASGLPNPEISWALPDGTMVNPVKQRDERGVGGGRSRRYVVFDNGTLFFNDVGMPEEGDYTCYAENQLGKDEMKVRVKVKVASSPPKIQDKDQKIVRVFYGETVTLRCNTRGESTPIITWISPTNRVISPAFDKYQILDDGTLVVQKVQRFDGGNYTCMARNNAGQDHKVVRLEVLLTPPVINGLSGAANAMKVAAVQDQRRFVDCVAKGTPTPRVMWVLPGNVILPAPYHSNRMTVHQNGTLEIRSPKRSDSGQLVCIARNEGGEVRLVVHLDVKDLVERPQTGSPNSDNLLLSVGNAVTLNCSFEGSTLLSVTWILPNGSPLQSGARFSKFFHQPNGSLVISNPSVSEAGVYRCLGRNARGLVENTITLTPGRKPEISNRYNSPVSIMNGETLSLHCLTNGEPVRLAWTLPSGVVLNRPQRAGRYAVLPNGTLSIQQISVYDRGSYVCRAANEYGSSALSVSVIVIAYPPRITNGPPSVTYAKRGVAVQLNCVATGIPKVDIAWETPDKTRLAVSAQPRLFGNKYLHPQGSLIIQNPTQRDSGVYRCTARNAIGLDSKATFLNVF